MSLVITGYHWLKVPGKVDNSMIIIPILTPVGIIADPVLFWEGKCRPGYTQIETVQ